MKDQATVEFDSVKVDELVIAQIIAETISENPALSLAPASVWHNGLKLLGKKKIPGVQIKIGSKEDVSIDINVLVQYGVNIPETAKGFQNKLKEALKNTLEININDFHVNVVGIERGTK